MQRYTCQKNYVAGASPTGLPDQHAEKQCQVQLHVSPLAQKPFTKFVHSLLLKAGPECPPYGFSGGPRPGL